MLYYFKVTQVSQTVSTNKPFQSTAQLFTQVLLFLVKTNPTTFVASHCDDG